MPRPASIDSSAGKTPASKSVLIQRSREACTNCRELKTRCLSNGTGAHSKDPCARCAKYNLECTYWRKRSRRPARRTETAEDSQLFSRNSAYTLGAGAGPLPGAEAGPGSAGDANGETGGVSDRGPADTSRLSTVLAHRSSPDTFAYTHPFGLISDSLSTILPPPVPTSSLRPSSIPPSSHNGHVPLPSNKQTENPGESLANDVAADETNSPNPGVGTSLLDCLEPHLGRDDSRPASPRLRFPERGHAGEAQASFWSAPESSHISPAASLDDTGSLANPVTLGFITELEAEHLFRYFMTKLNPFAAMFDDVYHTYERVRTSASLFTSILFSSARFCYPSIAHRLLVHAETLINRAYNRGLVDQQTVQALLVLVIWKLPNDRSAYLKIGNAVRGAYQLRLNVQRTSPLPQDELQARKTLDSERTWLACCNMDRAYSGVFDLPTMATEGRPNEQSIRDWALEHRHLNIPGDFYMAYGAGLQVVMTINTAHNRIQVENRESRSWDLANRERYHIQHLQAWLDGPYFSHYHRLLAQTLSAFAIMQARSLQLHLAPNETTKLGVIASAEEMVGHLERLAAEDALRHWSDITTASIPNTGLILYNAWRHMSKSDYDRVCAVTNRLVELCRRLSDSHTDHAFVHVTNFYHRLQKVFERLRQGDDEGQTYTAFAADATNYLNMSRSAIGLPFGPADQAIDMDGFWEMLQTQEMGFGMTDLQQGF